MEWLALLGLVIGAISVIESANSTQRTNERNIKANKELQQMQNEFQKAETDRLNQYNLPVNQRQRLEDAGLNPMLAMQGMSALGTSTSVPSSHGVDLKAPDYSGLGDAFSGFNNTMLESQRVRNDAEYQTGMVEADIMNARANMINANTQAGRAIKQNSVDEKTKELLQKQVDNYDRTQQSIRDLNNSHANYFDQASLHELEAAGLDKAQANDIVKTQQARIQEIQARAYALWQQGARDKSEAAFTNWWLTGDNHDVSSKLAQQLTAQISKEWSEGLKNDAETMNINQMTDNQEHNAWNWLYNTSEAILPAAVAAGTYGVAKGKGSKPNVNYGQETYVVKGKDAQGRPATRTRTGYYKIEKNKRTKM